jgi:2Fe-2S ferredoxin
MRRATEVWLSGGGRGLVEIIFRTANGATRTIDAKPGESLMSQAKIHLVAGIDADCGGSMVCGTCHVVIDDPWFSRLPGPSAEEAALVEYGLDPRENSRLSCQVVLTGAMDGMTVAIPPTQK